MKMESGQKPNDKYAVSECCIESELREGEVQNGDRRPLRMLLSSIREKTIEAWTKG